jgi:preprotein translocase subunit SecE
MNILSKTANFLKEVKLEMKKVTWPTKKETLKHTTLVIGISLGVAAFLGILDFIYTWLINKFII